MEDFRYLAYPGLAVWLEVVENTGKNKYFGGRRLSLVNSAKP